MDFRRTNTWLQSVKTVKFRFFLSFSRVLRKFSSPVYLLLFEICFDVLVFQSVRTMRYTALGKTNSLANRARFVLTIKF